MVAVRDPVPVNGSIFTMTFPFPVPPVPFAKCIHDGSVALTVNTQEDGAKAVKAWRGHRKSANRRELFKACAKGRFQIEQRPKVLKLIPFLGDGHLCRVTVQRGSRLRRREHSATGAGPGERIDIHDHLPVPDSSAAIRKV